MTEFFSKSSKHFTTTVRVVVIIFAAGVGWGTIQNRLTANESRVQAISDKVDVLGKNFFDTKITLSVVTNELRHISQSIDKLIKIP